MSLPGNGIFVLRGEISTLITAVKRGARWNNSNYQEDEQDGLLKQFTELKNLLISIEDLRLIDPNVFLAPFLDVIRSEETTGQITSLALSALNKFLSYGLIDPTHSTIAVTVENIADAVTHAKFVGSDQASDGVVLMKIVQVLRTLMLSPEGSALTNESVCEVMLSCFRICFEPRLNELIRRAAEHALKDIILLLFIRLPQFAEERHASGLIKKLKMMSSGGGIETSGKRRRSSNNSSKHSSNRTSKSSLSAPTSRSSVSESGESTPKPPSSNDSTSNQLQQVSTTPNPSLLNVQKSILATTPSTPVVGNIVDMQGKFMQTPHIEHDNNKLTHPNVVIHAATPTSGTGADDCSNVIDVKAMVPTQHEDGVENDADVEDDANDDKIENNSIESAKDEHASNSLEANPIAKDVMATATLSPYGLPCIRELLRFLITLINPLDKQNTDAMIHMGLNLLTIALEVGADSIGNYDTLLEMVKDDLCRNLFSLLSIERLTIFAADLQVCFLLFESQRSCLKFHLEFYLNKLAEIIGNENPRTPYEIRELALDNLLQFLRIPSFAAELYINYDCNLYCTNLLEDLVKLLSKNSLSATQAIYTIHEISLDGLMTIISDIEKNCSKQPINANANATISLIGGRHSRNNSTADKITIDQNCSDLDATTSGGEDHGPVETIHSFIRKNLRATNIVPIDEDSFTENVKTENIIEVVSHDQLNEVKNRKHILSQGTEIFNQRPEKGIQFLQENNYLKPELDPVEVAHFLRENSSLDKKMIGEYISKKRNENILNAFVRSFNFENIRIDMALRQFLEIFRLPGEAPLIHSVLEHFADHWHVMNNQPFATNDAAFTLAYAIIILNVDQHNHNARKANIPMTAEDFQRNLRGVNRKNGEDGDFDQDMLVAIFNAIRNEEIIMPAEQTGLVRENYLWKVLLRRNNTKDGRYLRVDGTSLDKSIYQLVWGPTLAALSFMFDRSTIEVTYHKSLVAFSKGAEISAHFKLHDDFNALILTLCKFTTLLNNLNNRTMDGNVAVATNTVTNTTNDITTSVQFGLNTKARLALKGVFALVHKHGDCLRCDGWKNVIEVILQLFKLKLLPKSLMEVEDFCEASGKVILILEKPLQKQDVGLFSSIYMYLSSDGQREPSYEEQQIIKIARQTVKECQLDQIIGESKFLQVEALQKLIQCLLGWLKPPVASKAENILYAEDSTVFVLEFLVKILIQNRDRLLPLWTECRDQIYLLLLGSSSYGYNYLLLRTTIALLKLAIYLMRNEELCPVVLQSLKMFLLLNPTIILKISRQISSGLYELLKTSAQNIHTEGDWDIIFTLLECVGAGAIPADYEESSTLTQAYQGAKSEGALSSGDEESAASALAQARGYISDSEISTRLHTGLPTATAQRTVAPQENWYIVNKDQSDVTVTSRPNSPVHSLIYPCKLMRHSTFALVKCWDCLAFIVRNVAHITPYNFESCVKCIRTFVEASMDGGNLNPATSMNARKGHHNRNGTQRKSVAAKRREQMHANSGHAVTNANSSSAEYPLLMDSDDDMEDSEIFQRYETISIQLLDLMHTLHTRTAQIFRWWAEENGSSPQCSALWAVGWCPILQGIARLATDQRKQVRTSAVTCLQRSLLVHDLQTLTGPEWESCFKQVLFPLLYDLLMEVPNANINSLLLEESRMRAASIMAKVFLHHLTPLIALGTFSELWLEIFDYIEKFMGIGAELLREAMIESLKNMLLVMHSVQVFHNVDGSPSPLWELTWKRVNQFLPDLKEELFDKKPMLTNRAPKPQMENRMTTEPQPTVLNPIAVSNQEPEATPIQQQPSSIASIPMSSIILDPPEKPVVNPNNSLFTTGNQPQQSISPSITIVPQPIDLKSQPPPTHPIEIQQSNVIAQSQSLIYGQPIPANPELLPIPFSIVPSMPDGEHQHQHQQQFIAINNQMQTQTPNMEMEKVPCINPNFSKIIEMSVTPSPPPLIEVDETLENQCAQESPINCFISNIQTQPEPSNYNRKNDNSDFNISTEPKIPLSHLNATNQYPSLNRIPPANIVQSFAPVYTPANPNWQQQSMPASNENEDLYSSYVNNPYNLTLQVDQTYTNPLPPTSTSDVFSQAPLPSVPESVAPAIRNTTENLNTFNSNIFQSINYFGAASDANIPPGSEMLFGNP